MSTIRNLTRDYGDFKIDISSWEILDAGVTSLWGPSGAGKTSVFRLLLGLDQPDRPFTWIIDGIDLAKLPTPERRLGVVFQSLELFPHMSAEGNIRFAAEARKIPSNKANRHFDHLISSLNLQKCLKKSVSVLSGGERQRTALARALIGQPRVLFLDEPFTALDSGLREEARTLVKQVIFEERVPTVLISHDREDLKAFGGKVSEIQNGKITHEW